MEKEKTVLNNNKNILQTIFHIIMGFLISVFSQILRIVIIDRTYFLTRLNEGLFTFLTFIHYFYFFLFIFRNEVCWNKICWCNM